MKKELNCERIFVDVLEYVESIFTDFTYRVMENKEKFIVVLFEIETSNDFDDFIELRNFSKSLFLKYPCYFDINCSYNVTFGNIGFELVLIIREN